MQDGRNGGFGVIYKAAIATLYAKVQVREGKVLQIDSLARLLGIINARARHNART